MLTAEKPIASEQLTFELPTSAYDIAAVNPTLVAEGSSPAGGTVSIDSGASPSPTRTARHPRPI